MPEPNIVINQKGPLPIKATFSSGDVGATSLFVSGSVWTQRRNTSVGINVLFNGKSVGKLRIWSNTPATHRTVPSMHIPIKLNGKWTGKRPPKPPVYTVELQPLNRSTLSDVNDWYQVVVLG